MSVKRRTNGIIDKEDRKEDMEILLGRKKRWGEMGRRRRGEGGGGGEVGMGGEEEKEEERSAS